MRILKILVGLLAAIALIAVAVALFARFTPGPVGPFPGGPLEGEIASGPAADWGFVAEQWSVELQLDPVAPRSVTTWIVLHEGAPYIPAAFAETKVWPERVMQDGRVVLGVGGALYELQAERVDDEETRAILEALVAEKYELDGDGGPQTWFFRLGPRS